MAVFNGAFPILEGRLDAARDLAAALAGVRNDEFGARHNRNGTTRETWSIQETPAGAFILVWFEGDIEKAFVDLGTANDDFTTWFRDQIKAVTGIDMSEPAGGGPELLLDWTA